MSSTLYFPKLQLQDTIGKVISWYRSFKSGPVLLTVHVCYLNVEKQEQVAILLLRQFPTPNNLKQMCIYRCGDWFCYLISLIHYFAGNEESDKPAGSNQAGSETKNSEDEKCCEQSRSGPFKHWTSSSVIQKRWIPCPPCISKVKLQIGSTGTLCPGKWWSEKIHG